jgi:hypothetical protein
MRHCLLSLAAITLLGLTSCRDSKITTYRVPKEKSPAIAAAPAASANAPGANMANTAVTTANGPGLTWTAPAQWTAKPTSAMRKGSYAINDDSGATADLSITAFPGDVGGDLANVNRWRGQIQLPPLASAELARATNHIDVNGLHLTTVDFTGGSTTTPQRVLGAIIPVDNATWFFKLSGPAALVGREQSAFAAFLQTIRAPSATP